MSEDQMTLAELVRVYRNQKKLSLQDVADAAGCSKQHVHEIEKGRVTNLTVSTILGLASALWLPPETIFRSAVQSARYRIWMGPPVDHVAEQAGGSRG